MCKFTAVAPVLNVSVPTVPAIVPVAAQNTVITDVLGLQSPTRRHLHRMPFIPSVMDNETLPELPDETIQPPHEHSRRIAERRRRSTETSRNFRERQRVRLRRTLEGRVEQLRQENQSLSLRLHIAQNEYENRALMEQQLHRRTQTLEELLRQYQMSIIQGMLLP